MPIEDSTLETWLGALDRGERLRLHRQEQADLVVEVMRSRATHQQIKDVHAEYETQIRVLRTQVDELNRTVSTVQARGVLTSGISDPPGVTQPTHGQVAKNEEMIGMSCDWGNCMNPGVLTRFDAYGFGWLPVCEECSKKPV